MATYDLGKDKPENYFIVTYFKPAGTSHLIARPNWTNDPDASIELGEFLEQACTAANDKARRAGVDSLVWQ